MTAWDPAVYDRYKAYRERPADDLTARLPPDLEPREIWDLGCGAGEHAARLKRRYPRARVHGLDSSPEMLARARARPEAVEWLQADIAGFDPAAPPDLIFTNAALQWLGDHERLFPRLVETLAPGGVFACQVPVSFDTGWRRLLRQAARSGPWAERLADVRGVQPVDAPEDYYGRLAPLCADVDIWTTTYLHVLRGEDPVVDWMSGTGLRPYLQALPDSAEREAFLDVYRRVVAEAMPPRPDGSVLFPFPRLFIVARRPPP